MFLQNLQQPQLRFVDEVSTGRSFTTPSLENSEVNTEKRFFHFEPVNYSLSYVVKAYSPM